MRHLPWLIIYFALSSGCSVGLREQQSLTVRIKAAAADCKAKPERCPAAKRCADRVVTAQKAINAALEARSKGNTTSDMELEAAGSYAAADAICRTEGRR